MLTVRRFSRADWDWYREWFADRELDRRLGPIDEEWLTHVLEESDGVQLVVEQRGHPVAVVGCVWGAPAMGHAITDLAVAPFHRRQGFGSVAVDMTTRWPGHPPTNFWCAYVELDNEPAFDFFTSRGWSYLGVDDGMHAFRRDTVDVTH